MSVRNRQAGMPVLLKEAKGTMKRLRFLFVSPVVDEEFFDPVKKGMRDAAEMMDVEAAFIGTEGVDVTAQAVMITQAVADGYDGIAVCVIDPQAFNEAVRAAMQKGVPVVAFNTDIAATGRMSAVSQDLVSAGRTLGAKAAEFVPKGGTVLITMHDPGVASLEQRRDGIIMGLDSLGIPYKVAIAHSTPQGSAKAISKVMRDDTSLQFVCATGQADTEGAALVIEREYNGKGYGVAGFDLSLEILRLIETGVIKFTIDQQPYTQGFYPVIQLALYCRYGIMPADIDAGATVITKVQARGVMELKKHNYR